MKRPAWKCAFTALILVCMSSTIFASGFAVVEQSVRNVGTANAGGAAAADDVSTLYYNPAGLTRLPGSQFEFGIHAITPSARFSNEGSIHATGAPLSGTNGGDAGKTTFVPNLYYAAPVSGRVSAGLGVYSPFGLRIEYPGDWVGRYHALKSDLRTVNINPAVAYRASDRLSVGAGLDVQYIRAELSNAIDFGTIFTLLGAPGFTPQGNDGIATMKADSWALGYNAGVLYEWTAADRTGIAYRSRCKQKLKGTAAFSGVPQPNPTGRFIDSGVKADVTLPDTVSISHWHALSERVAVMAGHHVDELEHVQ